MAYTFGTFMNQVTSFPINMINSLGSNARANITTAGSVLGSTVGSISSSLTLPLMIGAGGLVLFLVLKK